MGEERKWLQFTKNELQVAALAEIPRGRLMCCLHLLVEGGLRGIEDPEGTPKASSIAKTIAEAKEMALGHMPTEGDDEWMYQLQVLEDTIKKEEALPMWKEAMQLVKDKKLVEASSAFLRALLNTSRQFIRDLVADARPWIEYYCKVYRVAKNPKEFNALWSTIDPADLIVPENTEDTIPPGSPGFNPFIAKMIEDGCIRQPDRVPQMVVEIPEGVPTPPTAVAIPAKDISFPAPSGKEVTFGIVDDPLDSSQGSSIAPDPPPRMDASARKRKYSLSASKMTSKYATIMTDEQSADMDAEREKIQARVRAQLKRRDELRQKARDLRLMRQRMSETEFDFDGLRSTTDVLADDMEKAKNELKRAEEEKKERERQRRAQREAEEAEARSREARRIQEAEKKKAEFEAARERFKAQSAAQRGAMTVPQAPPRGLSASQKSAQERRRIKELVDKQAELRTRIRENTEEYQKFSQQAQAPSQGGMAASTNAARRMEESKHRVNLLQEQSRAIAAEIRKLQGGSDVFGDEETWGGTGVPRPVGGGGRGWEMEDELMQLLETTGMNKDGKKPRPPSGKGSGAAYVRSSARLDPRPSSAAGAGTSVAALVGNDTTNNTSRSTSNRAPRPTHHTNIVLATTNTPSVSDTTRVQRPSSGDSTSSFASINADATPILTGNQRDPELRKQRLRNLKERKRKLQAELDLDFI